MSEPALPTHRADRLVGELGNLSEHGCDPDAHGTCAGWSSEKCRDTQRDITGWLGLECMRDLEVERRARTKQPEQVWDNIIQHFGTVSSLTGERSMMKRLCTWST